MQPDIVARVTMFAPDAGGKSSAIPAVRYGCPLFINGQGFDCRLLLDQEGHGLEPGATAEVPIKFLYFDLVRNLLVPGARFTLWEMRHFAEGEILQVCRSS